MAPMPLKVVERRSNPTSTTGEGGLIRDSNGNWWREVRAFGPDSTNAQRAIITEDGEIRIIHGR